MSLEVPQNLSPPGAALPVPSLPVPKTASSLDSTILPSAGCLPSADYERLVGPWRANIRSKLVESLRREMPYLEWIQSFRTEGRDLYFVKSSLLGTHTAFMIGVSVFFWFGLGTTGRGLLYVLAAGGYITSVLKDLFCVPRPFSPPLVRLAVGNHALEYGFPSTHSTNSVSMALYFGALLMKSSPEFSLLNAGVYTLLFCFALTVTFGRNYTGMHSMIDVGVGSIIGVLVWLVYWLLEANIEIWTLSKGWHVTVTFLPATLFLVFVHPAPAEDCPCFEDAVAFVSVVAGILVGRNWYPYDFNQVTLGNGWEGWEGHSFWIGAVLVKLVVGVLAIFTWRLIAKEVCHAILPPLFRLFSSFLLPRRHYIDATEYGSYKPERLHPVPSLLDLGGIDNYSSSLAGTTSTGAPNLASSLRNRSSTSTPVSSNLIDGNGTSEKSSIGNETESREREEQIGVAAGDEIEESEKRIRRDADVLTKVFVYAGIGWIATIGIPGGLEMIGLSVSI